MAAVAELRLMPHTTKEERDSARGALGACDCFQCRLLMDFDELARASAGSTGAPLDQPTPETRYEPISRAESVGH